MGQAAGFEVRRTEVTRDTPDPRAVCNEPVYRQRVIDDDARPWLYLCSPML